MKITLSDIAKKTNVTISTVQRALNGGGGVSEEKRLLIQQVASELGYKRNIHAALLRGGRMRIAVIYPDTAQENRFYSHYLWAGIRQFVSEIDDQNIEVLSLTYERSPGDHTQRLQEVAEGKYGALDGVITRGTLAAEIIEQLKKLQDQGIPVVLTGADIKPQYRLCCVRCHEQIAGRLAADMFLNFGVLQPRAQVIVCGNFMGLNQFNNSQGFEQELWDSGQNVQVLKLSSDVDTEEMGVNIRQMLNDNQNISAIYACSARSTILVCQVVQEMGFSGKIRIVGSDLFQESAELLRNGVLSALIHNRPFSMAHQSIQALVRYLSNNNERPKNTILINSEIVMGGNLDYYLRDIPALLKFADPERLAQFDEGMTG